MAQRVHFPSTFLPPSFLRLTAKGMVSAAPPGGQNCPPHFRRRIEMWLAQSLAVFQPIVLRQRTKTEAKRQPRGRGRDHGLKCDGRQDGKSKTHDEITTNGRGAHQGLSTFAYTVACGHEQDMTEGCSCFKENLDPVLL